MKRLMILAALFPALVVAQTVVPLSRGAANSLYTSRALRRMWQPGFDGSFLPDHGFQAGGNTGTLSKLMYKALVNGHGLRLRLVNFSGANAPGGVGYAETANINPIYVEWGAKNVTTGEAFKQGTCLGGQLVGEIPAGMTIATDPLDLDVVAGDTYEICIRVTYDNGVGTATGQYPAYNALYVGTTEFYSTTTTTVAALSTADSLAASTTSFYPYRPAAVETVGTNGPFPVVAVIGDSIGFGINDVPTASNPDAYTNPGPIAKGLIDAGVPFIKICKPSDTIANNTLSSYRLRRFGLLDGCTDALVLFGRNDISAGTSAATNVTNITQIISGLSARLRTVTLCTIPPKSSMTSKQFVDLTDQTVETNNAIWAAFNADILGGIDGAGSLDIASSLCMNGVSTVATNDKWIAGPTTYNLTANATGSTTSFPTAYTGAPNGANNNYENWVIEFTSGANSGTYAQISSSGSTSISFPAIGNAVANGDTATLFQAYTADGTHPTWLADAVLRTVVKNWALTLSKAG